MQLSSAPNPEDYLAATNSYLEVIMYATDDYGLTSTTVRNVYPQLVEVCIDSEPQGLEVYVDEYPIKTPMMITSWVNHDIRLRVAAQEGYTFYSWNDAVVLDDREVHMKPSGNIGMLAIFCSEGNNTCIAEAEARASESLLVARCPTDAPTASPTVFLSEAPTLAPSHAASNNVTAATDEPIPERPHDEEDPLWDEFEEDAAMNLKSNWAIVAGLAILFHAILLLA
jgi:hypothetical protein